MAATASVCLLSAEEVGILAAFDQQTSVNDLLGAMAVCDRWDSHFAWARYVRAEQVYDFVSNVDVDSDVRVLDDFALAATRLAAALTLSKYAASALLREALALVYRIPEIGGCLRDGVISAREFQKLVVYTELIESMPYCPDVDADIAAELRCRGVWSLPRLRDMASRVICRYDPHAVRHRRDRAKKLRDCWSRALPDGMAQWGVIASAEDVALAVAAVNTLAGGVCAGDPRSVSARRSDAAICRLQQVPFECLCGRAECGAAVADDGGGLSVRQARIVVHVICQDRTLAGDAGAAAEGVVADSAADGVDAAQSCSAACPEAEESSAVAERTADPRAEGPGPDFLGGDAAGSVGDGDADVRAEADRIKRGWVDDGMLPGPPCDWDPAAKDTERPGFLDGHGVISAGHVREIAARPDAVVRVLNPVPGVVLPACLPSDLYRFSAALDTFVRARDGYCVFPGCTARAWVCDIDHVTEFDHFDPVSGGVTSAVNANVKCRFHHLVKTFGAWLDDQQFDGEGNVRTVFVTPEGLVRRGVGRCSEGLFPALRGVRFAAPPAPSGGSQGSAWCAVERLEPRRRRSRAVDKYARRRCERERNRRVFGDVPPF